WQAAYLHGYADGSARLFFAFHHLIIDAVSWRILAEDVEQLLSGGALGPKTSSYRQWVQAVQNYAEGHQGDVGYWQGVTSGQQSLFEQLGDDLADSPHTCEVVLSKEATDQLLHRANEGYNTEINDLLLAALTQALQASFGRDTFHITLEGHGREPIDDAIDVSHTVGWFTTAYPVRLQARASLEDVIIETKESLRRIPDKGIGFGALTQAGLLVHSPLSEISFNYLGQLGDGPNTFDNREQPMYWHITSDVTGHSSAVENVQFALLSVNAMVFDGQLHFGLLSVLPSDRVKAIGKAIESALLEVIEQASGVAARGGVKTPSDYSVPALSIDTLKRINQSYDVSNIFSATSLQQGFVALHLNAPSSDAYRVQLLLDYDAEDLDVDLYIAAWRLASLRYPVLRLAFDWRDDQVLQVITAKASISRQHFTLHDFSQRTREEYEKAIAKLQISDRAKRFDLSKSGLIRLNLIRAPDNRYTLIKTTHHSISDGWSGPILMRTVHQYYDALVKGETPEVEEETA
ncbi:condensation domain-containing protein, partial [Microbulbifer aggregans]|uniref:condensation domain-containing protein n=1 Tax=Microbulbifer aggregans TaxID=1769779 RepID=UPI001CFE6147